MWAKLQIPNQEWLVSSRVEESRGEQLVPSTHPEQHIPPQTQHLMLAQGCE